MAQQERNTKLVQENVFDQYDSMVVDVEVDEQMLRAALNALSEFPEDEYKQRDILEYTCGMVTMGIHLTGLSRRMSTVLCLLNQSYTQKSQRYVKLDDEKDLENMHYYHIVTQTRDSIRKRWHKDDQSDMLDKEKKLRLRLLTSIKDFYKYAVDHNVSSSDARYVLPLWCSTDMYMTITIPVLYDIYVLSLERDSYDFSVLLEQILRKLPHLDESSSSPTCGDVLRHVIQVIGSSRRLTDNYDFFNIHKRAVPPAYRPHDPKSDNLHDGVLKKADESTLESPRNTIHAVSRAVLMSRNEDAEDKFNNTEPEKLLKTINNVVLGNGHTSILEHQEACFVEETHMSLSCIHQYIRHRHKKIRIDYGSNMPYGNAHMMSYYTPESIFYDRDMYTRYMAVMDNYKNYLNFMYEDAGISPIRNYLDWTTAVLPNAAEFAVTTTTNFRELQNFFKDRLCMTASEEIRHIAYSQYVSLLENNELTDILVSMAPPCFRGLKCKEGPRHCDYMGDIFKIQKKLEDLGKDGVNAILEEYSHIRNQEKIRNMAPRRLKPFIEVDLPDLSVEVKDEANTVKLLEIDTSTEMDKWRWATDDDMKWVYNKTNVLFSDGVHLVAADNTGTPIIGLDGKYIRLHVWDVIR